MRLHPLTGNLAGFCSLTVSGNWRIIFRFEGSHVADVDLVNYAVRLERAFTNPPADMWLRLQAAYDLRITEQKLKKQLSASFGNRTRTRPGALPSFRYSGQRARPAGLE